MKKIDTRNSIEIPKLLDIKRLTDHERNTLKDDEILLRVLDHIKGKNIGMIEGKECPTLEEYKSMKWDGVGVWIYLIHQVRSEIRKKDTPKDTHSIWQILWRGVFKRGVF